MASDLDVLIVGGGPVGLLLGGRLAQLRVPCRVLERTSAPLPHSRSIGIHPPVLERFADLGVVDAFLAEGVKVRRGHAFAGTRHLGALHFDACPPPYPFVLTLPQCRTERILEAHLRRVCPEALVRGVEVVGVEPEEDGVIVQTAAHGTFRGRFVVGCDGKRSLVREAAGIPFRGGAYPDTYLMGDFADSTGLGDDAALYFTKGGIVEAFPLPGGVRRWVVKTPARVENPSPDGLAGLICGRLGHRVPVETNTMLSAFGVERFLAGRFTEGRLALTGDAAHVVSPIGGQGMNLGWLGAWALAEAFAAIREGVSFEDALDRYGRTRRRAAGVAIRRAEFNTVMGRAMPLGALRDLFSWSVLHTPLEKTFARAFTMRGL